VLAAVNGFNRRLPGRGVAELQPLTHALGRPVRGEGAVEGANKSI
jgi:hypothetical protein